MGHKELGKNIATLRRVAGLNQSVLGAAARCTQVRISAIERGKSAPSERELRGIERVLGVDLRALSE